MIPPRRCATCMCDARMPCKKCRAWECRACRELGPVKRVAPGRPASDREVGAYASGRRSILRRLASLFLAATLTLTLSSGECQLEAASVDVVPPDTFRVLAVYRCGGLTCWERWVEVGDTRAGASRACEKTNGGQATDGLTTEAGR